ncbi:MAG: hypothetical protein KAI02_04180 [Gammaproteobacteria bacterium]|nr:hypothetical protein [Gammaproteobacteria bacterium]
MPHAHLTHSIYYSLTHLFTVAIVSILLISTSYANEIISASELSKCQKDNDTLIHSGKQLTEQSEQLATMKNEMSQLNNERNAHYAQINFQDQASVDQYNQLNNDLNHLTQQYDSEVKQFNVDVNLYNQHKVDLFNMCDQKKYKKES